MLGGGVPVLARVTALGRQADSLGRISDTFVEGATDATGRFRISVPPGRYTLLVTLQDAASGESSQFMYSRRGPLAGYGNGDTIQVSEQPVELLLAGGSLDLGIRTSPIIDGVTLRCEFRGSSGSSSVFTISVSSTVTGGELRFHLPLVPLGTYSARLRGAPAQNIWLPGTLSESAAWKIEATASRPAAAQMILPPPARISGSITGSWQTLESSPGVVAVDAASESRGQPGAYTTVSRDGRFSLYQFVIAPVRIRVKFDGAVRWIGGEDFYTARVFDLAPGEEITDVSLRESGIICRLEGPSVTPETYARVKVMDAGGTVVADKYHMTGDVITISGLRAGVWFLRVEPADGGTLWAPQWFDQKPSLAAASPLVLTSEGEVTTVTVRVQEGGRISGEVRTRAGQPVERVIVLAPADGSVEPRGVASSDPGSGEFTVVGLEDGDYRIGAGRYDGSTAQPWWYPGASDPDSAQVVSIRNHEEVTGLKWRLPL